MMLHRKIDHIVYCVPNIEDACETIGNKLGVSPIFSGYHKTKGTKNALLNLGNNSYLEVLAIDESNTKFQSNRWMGIDLIAEPTVTRWALKTDQITKDSKILSHYNSKMGKISNGSRLTAEGDKLTWSMILPLSAPLTEILPFMVDWSNSAFLPTERLESGCVLKDISFSSNHSLQDQSTFTDLGINHPIKSSDKSIINIVIEGPNGTMQL